MIYHVAGFPVMVSANTRLIQRCAVCGRKLIDTAEGPSLVSVASNGLAYRLVPFDVGSVLCEIDGTLSQYHAPAPPPENAFCTNLVEIGSRT